MPRDYSEAFLELQGIRREMAEIDAMGKTAEAIERIAAAVRVLAFHIQEPIENQP